MKHRAIRVEFMEGVKVKMVFQDGKVKVYDMKRLFERYPQVKELEDRRLFESGELNAYGVIWNDELDIDSNTVYECGEDVGNETVPLSARIAYVVTEARRRAGLSQMELASLTGIDQSDISKIERGVANPSINTLNRIAEALGTEMIVSLR